MSGWTDYGAPEVLALAQGAREVSEAVIDNSDFIQFTGSTATGRKVMERAARRLTPVSLELGGKDPMIVLEDADVELAANAAVWGAMFNAGQTCVSVERVYVLEPAYDAFVDAVVKAVQNLKVGAGEGYHLGAQIDASQVDITERHVNEALAAGARALTGGKRPDGPGSFYPPTVLVDVDHSMACMTEETFGPTLPIMKVATVGDAVRLANDSPYGLSATVFSGATTMISSTTAPGLADWAKAPAGARPAATARAMRAMAGSRRGGTTSERERRGTREGEQDIEINICD